MWQQVENNILLIYFSLDQLVSRILTQHGMAEHTVLFSFVEERKPILRRLTHTYITVFSSMSNCYKRKEILSEKENRILCSKHQNIYTVKQ